MQNNYDNQICEISVHTVAAVHKFETLYSGINTRLGNHWLQYGYCSVSYVFMCSSLSSVSEERIMGSSVSVYRVLRNNGIRFPLWRNNDVIILVRGQPEVKQQ
jgi:hypothetical protein